MVRQVWLVSKNEERVTGLSRYVDSLEQGLLPLTEYPIQRIHPRIPARTSAQARFFKSLGFDLPAFLSSYPLWLERRDHGLYHLTNQNLATLLVTQRLQPAVVTVHDIIPWIVQDDPHLNMQRNVLEKAFYRLAMAGLRRAEALIAISEYTRQTLLEFVGCSPGQIHVVYRAVDLARFRPLVVDDVVYQALALEQGLDYILYLGSDDPRKNLRGLIQAFAQIHARYPRARLIKAGASHFPGERQELLGLIAELGLQGKVIFIEHLPDELLPALYNIALVFVIPSYYEGFGLPALEAMACGKPVLASWNSSLPEVVGEAGMLFDPRDVPMLASCLEQLLENVELRQRLAQAGQERAQQFSLQSQAQQTLAVYEGLIRGIN